SLRGGRRGERRVTGLPGGGRDGSPERRPVSPGLRPGGGEPCPGRLGQAGAEPRLERVDARGKVQLTRSAERARAPPGSARHTPQRASRDRAERSGIRTSEGGR